MCTHVYAFMNAEIHVIMLGSNSSNTYSINISTYKTSYVKEFSIYSYFINNLFLKSFYK